jgi:hypothetical protein
LFQSKIAIYYNRLIIRLTDDNIDNLALACRRCNEIRYNFTTGVEPETQTEIPLFNPRRQKWSEHFIWSVDALRIIGQTDIGIATCSRLDLNDERRAEPFIQNARRQWVLAKLHPASDDPQILDETDDRTRGK